MITCRYPVVNQKKQGRQLIYWLSMSDFISSGVYFVSSFEKAGSTSAACETLALIGIFFPVSSFLWTDFIAYYLYRMIVQNQFYSQEEWQSVMRIFHFISWGAAGMCVLFVAAFGHAGKDSNNTGGWCWVKASGNYELFIWEMVGGKLVELTSCVVILPLLYTVAIRRLTQLERSSRITRSKKSASSSSSFHDVVGASKSPPASPGQVRRSPATTISIELNNPLIDEHDSNDAMRRESSVDSEPSHPQRPTASSTASSVTFREFYLKMGAVPVVFFLIRLWGNVRIFIYAFAASSSPATDAADGWMRVMHAVFDPSQGFFNSLIFVLLSREERTNVLSALCHCFKTFPATSIISNVTDASGPQAARNGPVLPLKRQPFESSRAQDISHFDGSSARSASEYSSGMDPINLRFERSTFTSKDWESVHSQYTYT